MHGKVTRNQNLVLDILRAAAGQAVTAYEILARLEAMGVRGPQTVYRALDALRRAGLVHRIESMNAFTVCVHDHTNRHRLPDHDHDDGHRPAFAVCRGCGAVQELEDVALTAVLRAVADRTGYRVEDRIVELVGTCPTCAAASHGPAGRVRCPCD